MKYLLKIMHCVGDVSNGVMCIKNAGRSCSLRHPTYLHDDSVIYHDRVPGQWNSESRRSNPISHCIEVCNMNSLTEPVSHSLIVPVWLHHVDNPDNKFMVCALLDDQSDVCFIKQTALEKLHVIKWS